MNLVIDQGNTTLKLTVFEYDRVAFSCVIDKFDQEKINLIISKYRVKRTIFCSVKSEKIPEVLKKYNFLELSHLTPVPLSIKYKTPETLGRDRIAAVVGAQTMYPRTNLLVIDMGTCITTDFLNKQGEYFGGSISPGFSMRFKALNHFTGKLHLVKFRKEELKQLGDSTESSILSGVYYGVKNEIEGIVQNYITQYSDLKIVVTGGDLNLFDLEPKNRIFADNFLVLRGLNEILNYNEKN